MRFFNVDLNCEGVLCITVENSAFCSRIKKVSRFCKKVKKNMGRYGPGHFELGRITNRIETNTLPNLTALHGNYSDIVLCLNL